MKEEEYNSSKKLKLNKTLFYDNLSYIYIYTIYINFIYIYIYIYIYIDTYTLYS